MEGHAYLLVSLGVSSQWASHTQQHSTLTSPGTPCHKHVHLILGLMSTSLEHHRGNAVPPASRLPKHLPWWLQFGQIYTGADEYMQRRT